MIPADGLFVKVEKFLRERSSTDLAASSQPCAVKHDEKTPPCEPSGTKKRSSSCQANVDGANGSVDDKQADKQQRDSIRGDVSLAAYFTKNNNQSACSLQLGKDVVDGSYKSAAERSKPVVTLEQNSAGQTDRRISTGKKDDADSIAEHQCGSVRMNDSQKTESLMSSKATTDQSHRHHRSLSDSSSVRHRHRNRHHSHHQNNKPGVEQTLRNGQQVVPPLKIRVEHHRRSADQPSSAAIYSVDNCGSENTTNGVNKTGSTKSSEMVPVSAPAAEVAETKDVARARDVSKEDEKQVASDQRRTRSAGATRPVPLITKRRLTFEESLIAGTCISTTASSAITTDSGKMSATTAPSMVCQETKSHDVQECTAKPTTITKAATVLKLEKKELIPVATKKIKLEDEKSVSVQQLSDSRTASGEMKVKQRSANTANGDPSDVKSVQPESRFSSAVSAVLHCETKSVIQHELGDGISRSTTTKADDAIGDPVVSKNEASIQKNSVETGLAAVEAQHPNHSAKCPPLDRTSHRHRHHNHHDHHLRHSSSSSKPHRLTGNHVDYELKRSRHSGGKYGSLMHIETHPNGSASVVHAYEDELAVLSPSELTEFVREFFRVVFDEDPIGVPRYVMGIIHDSAAYVPDILEYFASAHPDMVVKRGHLGKSSDVETTTVSEYFQLVRATYLAGTYRTGPLDHFSIVGTKAEETGGYFPEFLDLLDQNEFLKYVSPWGKASQLENMPRNESNDGPIVWARPGEQVVPTADMPKSPMVKKRSVLLMCSIFHTLQIC